MTAALKERPLLAWAAFLGLFCVVPLVAQSSYQVRVANQVLILGLFAVSFNLLFGNSGLLSFGQALFYGLGAYATGMATVSLGPEWFVPMVFGSALAAGLLALVLSPLCLRLSGVYFTMLTLAFAQLGWGVVFKWYDVTGGDDGIQGIQPPEWLDAPVPYYYFTLALVAVSLWILWRLNRAPFGLVLRGVRQRPQRLAFLGLRTKHYLLWACVISGAFTGLAGGLASGLDGSIHPDMWFWTMSGEVILMAILGGMRTFFGPLVGAGVILIIEDVVGKHTENWSLVIGLTMLVMVLAFPRGIAGVVQRLRRTRTRNPGEEVADASAA